MRATLSPDSRLGLLDLKALTLMAHGLTDDDIGRELGIGRREVQRAVRRICGAVDAVNRTNAVALAYERGILLTGDRP